MRTRLGDRGAALVSIVALMLLLSIAALVVLQLVINHARTTRHTINRARASTLAEAGLVHAMWRLRSGDPALVWWPTGPNEEQAGYDLYEHWEYGQSIGQAAVVITHNTSNDFHTIRATVTHPIDTSWQSRTPGDVDESLTPP